MAETSAGETKNGAVAQAPKRSPNYPSLGPSEALRCGEKIWIEAKRNTMAPDLVYKYLGYKAKNGASIPVVAALKQYGILVKAGNNELRISDEAHTIYLAPKDLPERDALIRKLAMRPSLFREVLDTFPEGLPPGDSLLKFKVMQGWEFTNPKAADIFIKALREAVAIVGVDSGQENADSGSEDDAEEPPPMRPNNAVQANAPAGFKFVPAEMQMQPPPPVKVPAGMQARTWDLGNGATASLSLPVQLTPQNIERMEKYIKALKFEAEITWDTPPTTAPGTDTKGTS